ncbi:MAG: ATP-binding protein [Gammaproteobacteria bacterium]|nr:ATP-binding protein [Rhodoferax sp.]MBU3900489.1 ATP-binding protein [Gammaproteobacteria bacterium]MBU3996394.1 ATP-binding protein [Gammaproteobacteria bacterium]MBU4079934.1 ATP-binding protein [Gammaproteobacteria bacterium]MBU4112949.1 ATP-binding protein [Gammaproteobacteria bacterium]
MYSRLAEPILQGLLNQFPAVVLLGPRQAGKTTLAIAEQKRRGSAYYLDLELPSAQRQLDDPETFFLAHRQQLVILDEVQRIPELFAVLRGIIDRRRRDGEPAGQYLLLGSASGVLLQQSTESLAGRVAQFELSPFQAREVFSISASASEMQSLWIRGGFPLSWMATDDAASLTWRDMFIATYLDKDIPALGPRIPTTTLRRLWTMLAHNQGELLDQSKLAASLAVNGQTVSRYIDLLCDLMLVRRLPAWSGNVGKRLVRSPKVYVRDSGIVHALLGLHNFDSVLSHPVAGASWEGFVIEQLIAAAPQAQASFYRTSHGAEADLVLNFRNGQTWVIEIKRSCAPTVSKGYYLAANDVGATRKLLVAPVDSSYPMKEGVEVMNPLVAANLVAAAG